LKAEDIVCVDGLNIQKGYHKVQGANGWSGYDKNAFSLSFRSIKMASSFDLKGIF